MKIFARFLSFPKANKIILDVDSSDTIKSVKKKIQKEREIPKYLQRLLFSRVILENKKTISSYKIKENSILDLVLRFPEEIKIYVQLANGEVLTHEIQTSTTVGDLKSRIIQEKKYLMEVQESLNLFFEGKKLLTARSVSFYQVDDGSTLFLDSSLCEAQQIFIGLNSRMISLDYYEGDTIGDIKSKIEEAEGIPTFLQSLKVQKDSLDDWEILEDCGVTSNSTLILELHFSKIKIIIRLESGMEIPLEVEAPDKIGKVKTMLCKLQVCKLQGLQPEENYLFWCGERLNDENTLYDCQIQEGLILDLICVREKSSFSSH
ncbi:polyubiquitin-like [Belonocnema kinseyi]|uniref:polyubiquitin-like n=1 Tax=Belonocnema kinseyi TaxID=2817044 RepID=UPI00143D55F9|nr:polyubiquitin-like [Belonocnema kinseyi]